MEPITVLLVDDHTVAREGLRAMLDTDNRVEVVGEAANGAEALQRAAETRPQVVLMDIRMPGMDGIEATRRLKAEHPSTAVIILTSYDDKPLVVEAVAAGAAGYLLKDVSRDLLGHTIEAAAEGRTLIQSDLFFQAINHLRGLESAARPSTRPAEIDELTEREQAVLQILAEGRTNKEIGDTLALAEVTVKKHVQSIIAKLGASDRTQAAITALRLGLIH